ncbi:hypothetical protein GCM10010442_12350 [Kitasatospora kifunensis]|uniref:Uncharacterized protein n=1 Tax=Kitasatospora kifunensis TaxID=58351 RepID=A0A7W7VTF2_KITKI|nr:hypothetical protein [Kitasatospora kifunensis]
MQGWVNPKYREAVTSVRQLPRTPWRDGRLRPRGAVMAVGNAIYVVRPAEGKPTTE